MKSELKIVIEREPESGYGFIYILSNISMPSIYKIGLTTNSVRQRIKELNTTGVPTTFIAEKIFSVPINDLITVEKKVHRKLKKKELHHGKEFFEAELSICVLAIEDVIFEVTGMSPVEIINNIASQARNRAEAEQARERKLATEKEQLRLANRQIDDQRQKYIWELEERDKRDNVIKSYIQKYIGWIGFPVTMWGMMAILKELQLGTGLSAALGLSSMGYWFYLFLQIKTTEGNERWKRKDDAEAKFPYRTSLPQQNDINE